MSETKLNHLLTALKQLDVGCDAVLLSADQNKIKKILLFS